MERKFILLALIIVLPACGSILKGQVVIRQSINSYASRTSINGTYISQTVGQPFSTVSQDDFKTFFNPGFQQALLIWPEENTLLEELPVLKVFPNPASFEINIISENLKDAYLLVTDMNGRLIMRSQKINKERYIIDCSNWQNGFYLISIFNNNFQKIKSIKVLISK